MTAGLLLATTFGFSACSSSTSTPASSVAPSASTSASVSDVHNDADIEFAQMMIPHHEQAIEMAKMVPSHSTNPQLNAFAKQVEAAQAPEIAQMRSWLAAWGVSESASAGSMEGHGHNAQGDGSVPSEGMMTPAQMEQLEAANGSTFDTMWYRMMIEHHQGAVDMSKAELADGSNPQAKALASSIIKSQTAEIQQMTKSLN